ncbi:MAG TPA: hypothetical protein VNJ01_07635 [Bacteriovoracaceae bacterium]|nr:hypothetical protein [Bacteriovoracaceae bacterium]
MKSSKTFTSIMMGAALLALAACGGGGGSSNGSGVKPPVKEPLIPEEERQADEGYYQAELKLLNSKFIEHSTNGNIVITITGDDVVVKGRVVGTLAGVKHRQQIRVMENCPGDDKDLNGDGYLDANEILPVSGKVLIPLDMDLSEQVSGMNYGPIANQAGVYVYKRSTSLSRLTADLQDLDPDKQDELVKLRPGQDLNLADRHIVIFGVAAETKLPATVGASGDLSPEESLPIACGELERITADEAAAIPVDRPSVETL